jgi:hypothetical protein
MWYQHVCIMYYVCGTSMYVCIMYKPLPTRCSDIGMWFPTHPSPAFTGVVYSFGMSAGWLLTIADTPLPPKEKQEWWQQASDLLLAWYQLFSTAKLYHSSRTGPRGLWLYRPLVRLAAKFMSQAQTLGSPAGPVRRQHGITLVRTGMLMAAACPSAHPGLCGWVPSSSSFTPAQLEVCGANMEEVLQQQVRLELLVLCFAAMLAHSTMSLASLDGLPCALSPSLVDIAAAVCCCLAVCLLAGAVVVCGRHVPGHSDQGHQAPADQAPPASQTLPRLLRRL